MFLSAKKFKYLLIGTFHSDRLEWEFGVLRQLCGGNYYYTHEQILSSIKLRRLKLFALLEIPDTNAHENGDCCESDLTDDELILLDRCFEVSDDITTEVKSVLYYISEYVAMKEGLDDPQIQILKYPILQQKFLGITKASINSCPCTSTRITTRSK